MKFRTALIFAAVLNAGIASAQTSTPGSTPSQAGSTAAGGTLTPAQQANRDRIKGERETCRTKAQEQGAKGEAMRSSVQDCMAQVDPVAAKHIKCFQAGKAQNLSGDEMKKSVRQCMAGA